MRLWRLRLEQGNMFIAGYGLRCPPLQRMHCMLTHCVLKYCSVCGLHRGDHNIRSGCFSRWHAGWQCAFIDIGTQAGGSTCLYSALACTALHTPARHCVSEAGRPLGEEKALLNPAMHVMQPSPRWSWLQECKTTNMARTKTTIRGNQHACLKALGKDL